MPQFFFALVAGVILAFGFQMVLTNLSLAAGVTALAPVTDPARARRRGGRAGVDVEEELEGWGTTARRITSAFGIWAVVTASVALFFATWLAVQLAVPWSALVGAVLGLAIWGLFYIVMVSFEAAAFTSLAGSLFRTASAGLRGAWSATTSAFAPSPASQAADSAAQIARAVRQELVADIDAERIREEIGRYVRLMAPQPVDPARIREEIIRLFDEVELRAIARHEGTPLEPREVITGALRARHAFSPEGTRAVAMGVGEAVTEKAPVDKAADAAVRIGAGVSAEEAEATRHKVEGWLRETGKAELDPEGIKDDLQRLFSDPTGGAAALARRLNAIDRETVARVVAQRGDLSQDDARRLVEMVMSVIQGLRGRVRGAAEALPSAPEAPDWSVVRANVAEKLRAWADSLGRPEVSGYTHEHDLQTILDDPTATPEVLAARLRAMDRDTLKAIVASANLDPTVVDTTVEKMERARDVVIERAEKVQTEVKRRLEDARVEAVRRADEARQTAATAAWWGLAAAVVSGGAAAAGGLVAASAM